MTALAVDRAGDVVFMNGARRVRRLKVSEQRMETLLENPYGDLEKPREVVGLAVLQATRPAASPWALPGSCSSRIAGWWRSGL